MSYNPTNKEKKIAFYVVRDMQVNKAFGLAQVGANSIPSVRFFGTNC